MDGFSVLPRLVVRGGTARVGGPRRLRGKELHGLVSAAIERHGRILLWDWDGIAANRPSLDLLRRFEGEGLWVDGGVRHAGDVADLLVAGAERAVVGTKTLASVADLQHAAELTENLLLQVDYQDGAVLVSPTLELRDLDAFLALAKDLALAPTLLLDPDGLEQRALFSVRGREELFAGIVDPRNVPRLRTAGLAGAIVDLQEVP
jgi:hypothetical protein